jgi:hypothetical protein
MRAASKHRNSQRMSEENEEPVVSIEELAQEPAASASKAEAKPKQPKKMLWDYLEDEERDTDGTVTYVYRVAPIIDRKRNEHCICQKTGRFTRDQLIREFGSGVYKLMVQDANKKLLYNEPASFHNPDFPPRVDPLEVVASDPRNATYFATWGKKSTGSVDKAEKEETGGDSIAEILRAHSEGNKLDPQMVSWFEDTARHRDQLAVKLADASAKTQAQPIFDYAALAMAIKAGSPSPAPALDPVALMKAMKDLQPNQMTMLAEAKQLFAPAQAAIDGLAQFREIFNFTLDLVDARGGGGGGGRRSGWDVGVDILKEGGQHVLQPALAFIQNMMLLSKNQGAGATPPIPSTAPTTTPSAFDPYQNPQATRAYANTLNSQQSQQQPPAGQQPASSPPPPSPAPPPPRRRQ